MSTESVESLVAAERLEAVEPDRPAAAAMLDEARAHLRSAATVIDEDPNGAYALLCNAARKAVAAHMLASGYRTRNRPGAHAATCLYAEAALGHGTRSADVHELDRMRRIETGRSTGFASSDEPSSTPTSTTPAGSSPQSRPTGPASC